MKARLTITDDTGAVFEGEVELVAVSPSDEARQPGPRRGRQANPLPKDDLTLPARAFMHRHARGRSGPQSFALLVAWLAGGEIGREVPLEDVRREWERMIGLLGGFATIYATRAKNQAWVDSPRRGVFVLLSDWQEILKLGSD